MLRQVVRILKGDREALELARQNKTPSLRRTYSEELYSADEYNATKYLSDLDRYMQVILGRFSNCHELGDISVPDEVDKGGCSSEEKLK